MGKYIVSSPKNPCPVCDRTSDGDCRTIDGGDGVLCHTIQEAVAGEIVKGYKYTKRSDKGAGWGVWVRADDSKTDRPKGQIERRQYFDYPDRNGDPLLRAVRQKGGKVEFWQEYLIDGEWLSPSKIRDRYGREEGDRIIASKRASVPVYRYLEVRAAIDRNELIIWCEGEKTADALWSIGIAATTSIGGSGAFGSWGDYSNDLHKGLIVVAPDRDTVGIKYANQVAAKFKSQVVGWLYAYPDSPLWGLDLQKKGGIDCADWIRDGATKEEVLAKVEKQARLLVAGEELIEVQPEKPSVLEELRSVVESIKDEGTRDKKFFDLPTSWASDLSIKALDKSAALDRAIALVKLAVEMLPKPKHEALWKHLAKCIGTNKSEVRSWAAEVRRKGQDGKTVYTTAGLYLWDNTKACMGIELEDLISIQGVLRYWNGTHYEQIEDDLALRQIHAFLSRYSVENKDGDEVFPFTKSEHTKEALAYLKQGRTVSPMAIDREGINLKNGTLLIDWSDEENPVFKLHPHDKSRYYLYCSPVTYNPDAEEEDCDRLLEAIPEDQRQTWLEHQSVRFDLKRTRKRFGRPRAAFHEGTGSNGKDSCRQAIVDLFPDTKSISLQDFAQYDEGKPWRIASLINTSSSWSSENSHKIKLENLKSLMSGVVGNSPLTSEMKFGHPIEYTPDCVFHFNVNRAPITDGTETFITSRFVVYTYPFTYSSSGAPGTLQADSRFAYNDEWRHEHVGSALLNKLIRAFKEAWQRGKVDYSPCERKLRDWAKERNHFLQFCDDVGLVEGTATDSLDVSYVWGLLEAWYTDNDYLNIGIHGDRDWASDPSQFDTLVRKSQDVFGRLQSVFPKVKKGKHSSTRRAIVYGIKLVPEEERTTRTKDVLQRDSGVPKDESLPEGYPKDGSQRSFGGSNPDETSGLECNTKDAKHESLLLRVEEKNNNKNRSCIEERANQSHASEASIDLQSNGMASDRAIEGRKNHASGILRSGNSKNAETVTEQAMKDGFSILRVGDHVLVDGIHQAIVDGLDNDGYVEVSGKLVGGAVNRDRITLDPAFR